VPFPSEGLSLGSKETKLGIRCTSTANVIFEDVALAPGSLIGSPGQGFKIAMEILDAGRIPIAAQAVGIAADSLQRAMEHVMRKDVMTQVEEFVAVE
jgi:butyryl-CoA dehydrogenase